MFKYFLCFMILFTLQPDDAFGEKLVEVKKPYTYEILKQDLSKIQKKYKSVVEIKSIGTTYFEKNIWAVRLGSGKKNIVLIGSHHGREWLTSMVLMKMLETYADAYEKGKRSTNILNEVSIWFIPMLNPDGVMIQQNHFAKLSRSQKISLVKMNEGLEQFDRWKANGIGIDLNRQYPAGWEALKNEPKGPSYKSYKGKAPLEAEEVIALTKFIHHMQPIAAVAYHTAGREIFWKYKNGKHLKRDRKIAKKISKLTGYKLGRPDREAVGGGFTDWFITTYHRPALTIEISYLVGETNPPLSVFKKEWKRNKKVGLMLAKEAKKIK
ncbi:M14 family zinc carboxypeptidase [Bacillus sp. UNC438CL73TsuS30]|uniref:M14 family zinc carboxypeptidase n=1 Tax=Bacillus sp. UNC438CL73TsuS30 TaxID=1340434 RepID=UPI00047EB7D7|nr:M14 family zinc carboxypeptidase [Bacillus sp. UNC438CL73TsuS30]